MKNKLITLILGTAAGFAIAGAASAGTLDDVRQHGFVQCGVSQGLMGFSVPDAQNNWTGMDVDFCRAIAAAVLGDSTKVKFTPLTAKERFTALQSGEIDVLSRNTTWTMTRKASQLRDNRISPITSPSTVASTMPMAETSSVLKNPTIRARA